MWIERGRALADREEGVAATEGWRREERRARCGGTAVREGRVDSRVVGGREQCAGQSG